MSLLDSPDYQAALARALPTPRYGHTGSTPPDRALRIVSTRPPTAAAKPALLTIEAALERGRAEGRSRGKAEGYTEGLQVGYETAMRRSFCDGAAWACIGAVAGVLLPLACGWVRFA